jgi:cardiolipin synthase
MQDIPPRYRRPAGSGPLVDWTAVPEEQVGDELLTIPNLLSLARIGLIPVFMSFLLTGQDALALGVLVVTAVTDFLDGFLARRLHQVTRLGRVLDPIADRLMILTATLGLMYRGFLPLWLVLAVLARDVAMLALGILIARYQIVPPRVTFAGKTATALLLIALPLLVVAAAFPATGFVLRPVGLGVAILGAALYWVVGVGYILWTARAIVARRSDTPGRSATLIRQRRSPDGR